MKNSPTKHISEILQNSSLAQIVERANALNSLNDRIKPLLPEAYRPLYRISRLSGDELTFEVQNATVRQGLMWQQQRLLTLIQENYPEVKRLQFKVNPRLQIQL